MKATKASFFFIHFFYTTFDLSFFLFHYREFEDNTSLDGSLENMERGSIASFGSGGTTDSEHPKDKVT